MNNENKFWMLYIPSRGKPEKVHEDKESAINEAKRLVEKENKPVYVLEAIHVVDFVKQPIKVNNLIETVYF